MIPSSIPGLFNNIGLLICLIFLYDFFTVRQVEDKTVTGQIITGMILGVIGLSVMLNPWEFAHGIVFDTRSILLCIVGFFFGTVPVIITIIMMAAYRTYLGGGGMWMGIAVILTSGLVGLTWRYRLKEDWSHVSWKQIYLMGVVVHVLMLFWTILLPSHVAKNVFSNIFLPVLFLYPAGTALLGQFMIKRYMNKLTKKELIKSEERFNLAMNASKDGLWDRDITTDKAYYSPAYGEMLGYAYSEIPQQVDFWKKLMHPDDKDISFKANLDCIENQCDNLNIEFRLKMKNGGWKWINSRGKVVGRDDMGRATRMVGTHVDISEYKTNMEILRASEEKFRLAFYTSPDAINLNRLQDGVYIDINNSFTQMIGYTREEVIGKTAIGLNLWKNPQDRQRVIDGLQKNGYVENLEAQFVAKDGSIKDGLMCSRLLKINEESVFISITRDITDRNRVENELNFQAMLLNQIRDHITATDLKGNIIYVNEAVIKSLKQKKEELLGKSVTVYGEDLSKGATQKQIINATLRDGEWTGEIANYDVDGKKIIMNCRTKLVKDNNGNPISMVGISTDITEYKKMETRIQQAQKMESIGNLAGGIAHDFNNILYPIIGLSEMLIEDLPKNSPENENVKGILNAGKRGSELVKQILAFSRQNEHIMTPVRVQFVMKEVLKLIRASIPMNIEISQRLQSDCGLVLADSTQLHQIGMNLITNAYHAVESVGGKIGVQVQEIIIQPGSTDVSLSPGKYAMISVADNGVGIDPANKGKIFEPYFTTKKNGKGTGLGLSVVYGIIKEYRGKIKVYSEVGRGTTFNVYIPLIDKPDMVESISEELTVGTGTEHILLVDDEVPIADLEKQILERLGYIVTERTCSFDALEAFKANPDRYDLVISDMSMPHMTGDVLAREMLSIRPDLPIIICTGFSERINEGFVKEVGIKGFLMKPVIMSDMAHEVRRVLDEKNI